MKDELGLSGFHPSSCRHTFMIRETHRLLMECAPKSGAVSRPCLF
jgi:hypothetical protein